MWQIFTNSITLFCLFICAPPEFKPTSLHNVHAACTDANHLAIPVPYTSDTQQIAFTNSSALLWISHTNQPSFSSLSHVLVNMATRQCCELGLNATHCTALYPF